MRPPVQPPRELSKTERMLMRALALLDRINSFVDYSKDISQSDLDRTAHVAATVAMRGVFADHQNAARRAAWRGRFGGCERDLEASSRGTYTKPLNTKTLHIRMVGGGGGNAGAE